MIVLSLFDGISCGQIALERAGIKIDKYFASEIKKYAIEVTQKHYKNTVQLGDVNKVSYKNGVLYSEKGKFNAGKIDLLIGGSPCQNFSSLSYSNPKTGDSRGFYGSKSSLFWQYKRILEEVKPKYFLLENVKMKKSDKEKMDQLMGVDGLPINSNLVSFQNRERYYWTNIPNITLPKDKNINFKDFIDRNEKREMEAMPNKTKSRIRMWNDGKNKINNRCFSKNITYSNKVGCLTTKQDRCPNSGMVSFKDWARYLTRKEMELAQTLPVGYCDDLSYPKTCNVIGDGWTVDIISHIFSFIPAEYRGAKFKKLK